MIHKLCDGLSECNEALKELVTNLEQSDDCPDASTNKDSANDVQKQNKTKTTFFASVDSATTSKDTMNPKWKRRLTGALHRDLSDRRYYCFTKLPQSSNDFTEVFHSRSDCQKAVNQDIKRAWDAGNQRMDPDCTKCIAYPAAEFYTELLENWFSPILPQLKQIAEASNATGYFERLQDLITDSGEYLLEKFKQEFQDDPNYYQLYKLSYFQERPEIEEHDYRINQDEFFLGLLETLFTDNIEYICTGVNDAIREMQEDLDDKCSTFSNYAQKIFAEYLERIEVLLAVIEAKLPEMEEGEEVFAYMMRVG